MNRLSLVLIVCAIIGALSLSLIGIQLSSHVVVYHEKILDKVSILNEINRLLLPVSARTLTIEDLKALKALVREDPDVSDEVHELEVLSEYKEYSHVGHGLGSLYRYIQTGVRRVCPGHALAHHYVFAKHGERELADRNLREAREQVEKYSVPALIMRALARIDSGNSTANEDEIADLADTECV